LEDTLFEIEFYMLSDGRKPAEEFILNLPPKAQVKAYDSLEILQEKVLPCGNHIQNRWQMGSLNCVLSLLRTSQGYSTSFSKEER
jgi:hypothetical protein